MPGPLAYSTAPCDWIPESAVTMRRARPPRRFDVVFPHSISVDQPMRYFPRGLAADDSDGVRENRGRHHAIDVVIPENHDPLAVANRLECSGNRALEVRQLRGIEDVVPRSDQGSDLPRPACYIPVPPNLGRRGMNAQCLRQAATVLGCRITKLPEISPGSPPAGANLDGSIERGRGRPVRRHRPSSSFGSCFAWERSRGPR